MPTRTLQLNVVGDPSGARKALDEVSQASSKTADHSTGAFKGLLGIMNQSGAFGPLTEGLSAIGETFDKLKDKAGGIGAKLAGIGAGVAAGGGILTALAGPEEQAHAQLKAAIGAAGQDYDEFGDKIDKNVKSNEKLGHTSVDTQDAIRILTQATGDTGKALGDMGVVADLAAAKHESLAAAAEQLAKVHGGATKILKEFGITAEKATDSSKALAADQKAAAAADMAETAAKQKLSDLHTLLAGKTHLSAAEQIQLRDAQQKVTATTEAATAAHKKLTDGVYENTSATAAAGDNIAELGRKLDGQASAAADTFSGRMKALKVEIEDQAAQIGQKYGPAITAAGAGMSVLGGLLGGAQKAMGLFTTAQETSTGAVEAGTAATEAAGAAEGLTLGPILLIIAALVLLGVGIFELATHWKQVWHDVQQGTQDGVNAVTGAIGGTIDWLKANWQQVLGILTAPFGGWMLLVWHYRDQILNLLGEAPAAIGHIAESIGKALANGVISGINAIIGAWDSLHFGMPSFDTHIPGVGKIGGFDIGVPQIPKIPTLAQGGIAVGPTLAMVGEAGRPEAIVPLDRAGGLGFGVGAHDHEITVVLDGRKVGHGVARHVRDRMIASGRSNPTVLSGLTIAS